MTTVATIPSDGPFNTQHDQPKIRIEDNHTDQELEYGEIIRHVMMCKNKEGLNMVEQCCQLLFEFEEERFLIYVLKEVPDVCQYLYKTNDQGWFPIFRILNIFAGNNDFYSKE